MKVFADFHHRDLYASFHYLFEKRLGMKLYRPIGLDWFEAGYWKIAEPYRPNHMPTVKQYLDPGQSNHPQFANHPAGSDEAEEGVHYLHQPGWVHTHRGITFETFKKMDFDLIISSIPAHDAPYGQLQRQYHPDAIHISHVGNVHQQTGSGYIMASSDPKGTPVKSHQKAVFIRQEFDLDLFRTEPIDYEQRANITSCIHILKRPQLFYDYEAALPDFTWKMYGSEARDGGLQLEGVAEAMKKSWWGWFIRSPGEVDGYSGHIFLNHVATGRPLIVWMDDLKGFPPSPILIPDKTCIDLSQGTVEENTVKIREFSQPEAHNAMCEAMVEVAKRELNFDADEAKMRAFLEELGVL